MSNTSQIKALQEKRASIWSQMTEIMEKHGPDLPQDQASRYDALEGDLDKAESDAARLQAHDLKEAEYAKVDRTGVVGPDEDKDANPKDAEYARVFTTWMKRGQGALNHEDQNILNSRFIQDDRIQAAAGVGTGSAGGFTVPPAFRNRIVERMQYIAVMRQLAEVITTDTGATLPWPTVDDTANEGAILGENTADTEQDVVFGQAQVGAYMYTSKIVRASLQLLNDSGFNFEQWLANALAARIARIQNRHFTIGTGTSQPQGIVTGATVGKQGTTGQTTTVIYDDLIDLSDSIDLAYVGDSDTQAGFMMSQTTRKVVRKLKDSQNRPLWEPSLQVGVPDSLLGYRLTINNYMPAPAANAKSILFGNYNEAYLIRDVTGFALLRLAERYAEFLQVGFLGFQRSDGVVKNANAVRAYQHSAT